MSRSYDSASPKKRSELASECSNYHNDEVSCNLASDNGTPCIYKSGGVRTAPRCSPVSQMRNRLSKSISSGKFLSRNDILDIKRVRSRDKKHLERLRTQLIQSKDTVRNQRESIDNLLGALRLERKNCKQALRDLKSNNMYVKEDLRNKQRALKEKYEKKILSIQQDRDKRLERSRKIEEGRSELQELIRKSHKEKLDEIKLSCDLEKNKLKQELDTKTARFTAVKNELDRKNKEIFRDETELREQRVITKKRLDDIRSHERNLKQRIREFNDSKVEYTKLIAQLKKDKDTLEKDKRAAADVLSRRSHIDEMEKRVSKELDSLSEREARFDVETASVMKEISDKIDILDKARVDFNKDIKDQTKLLTRKEKLIKRRTEDDVTKGVKEHPDLEKFKRPSQLTVDTNYTYDGVKKTETKRVKKITTKPHVTEPETPSSEDSQTVSEVHKPVTPISEPVTPAPSESETPRSETESTVHEPVSPVSEPETPRSEESESTVHEPVSPVSEPETPRSEESESTVHEPVSPVSEPETPRSEESEPVSPVLLNLKRDQMNQLFMNQFHLFLNLKHLDRKNLNL